MVHYKKNHLFINNLMLVLFPFLNKKYSIQLKCEKEFTYMGPVWPQFRRGEDLQLCLWLVFWVWACFGSS